MIRYRFGAAENSSPIALALLLVSAALLALAAISAVTRDWRGELAEVESTDITSVK